jgi:2-oxo-4-hydroxy-4-carboxy-5-ureidoimidazoline decarboxylase
MVCPGMTLTELNASDRDQFVAALGWIFEDSPWVAARAWERRPFASVEELHTAMSAAVAAARPAEQMALLRAHPDLGTRARMSDMSMGEQAGAGLDSLTPAEFDRLQELNAAYRATFDFPFLFAVRGKTKHHVLDALADRLSAAPGDELAEALRQVSRIAWFRLHDIVPSAGA